VKWLFRFAIAVVALVVVGEILAFGRNILFRSERPLVATDQLGFRGTGLVNVYNPRAREELVEANRVPQSVPYAEEDGEKAGAAYENVQVLRDVGVGEFTRLMVNITEWVAPEQGCAACHNTENFADDKLYTKVVARRMLQMVRHINADWTRHVGQTGVTCYTCHRGKLVPEYIWFDDPGPRQAGGSAQAPAGQNHPAAAILGSSSLPLDPFTPFLGGNSEIRVQSTAALPADNRHSIKQTEWTYGLMMHMSQALGVNCNYCHNTRAFRDWEQSPPQRTTAWHGIRMVRGLNQDYLGPLQKVLPAGRLGPATGDATKVNCATCHNGVYKPLFGVSMAQNFPELTGTPARAIPAP
jgi:photosynthetic reaction center cytochrome c subunit